MLTVADIMITDVYRVSPFATLRQALVLMGERGVKSLVVDRRSEHDAFGLLAYSHILRTIVAEDGELARTARRALDGVRRGIVAYSTV